MSLDTTFLVAWRERLQQVVTEAQAHIVEGRMKDFSEYRYSLGYIKGLDDALKLADEVTEKMQKE